MAAKHLVLKEDHDFAVSATDGSMRVDSPDGHGVWHGDTRFLSDYRVLIDGRQPVVVEQRIQPGWIELVGNAGSLAVHRERFVDSGFHERITITNRGGAAAETEVAVAFDADFAAMLAVRGVVTSLPARRPATVTETPRGILLRESGGGSLATEVLLRPPGTRHRLHLRPGEHFALVVDVLTGPGHHAPDFDAGLAHIRGAYRDWASESATFETDNPPLNELLQQCRADMRMLTDRYSTGIYPTGGLPWFAVPFGRDALTVGLFALPTNPQLARGALRFLAEHQGRREDPATQEEPGKILHEVRSGAVVDSGLWPHILYGTVDATPLFLCVLAETSDWTGDGELFDELWPAAQAALGWCEKQGDSDGDSYIEYRGGRELINQGWKDSYDSLTNVDGSDVTRPAALCEVQGYLYRGLLGMSRKQPELKAGAAALRRRFNRDFWISRQRFVAQALDAGKRQVEAITSNPGHCLWSGILEPARARAVGARLVSPELFSGWGIRTLSTQAINFDPCSYHNGSVWPHDNAMAAAGLRAAGMAAEAELVARSILEAGMSYPDLRPPELFCGGERDSSSKPDDYPASCTPQNWAASAAFQMMSTLLGLEADARSGRLRVAPVETSLWRRLEVTGLHFAGHRLDFSIEGTRVKVGKLPRGVKVVRGAD